MYKILPLTSFPDVDFSYYLDPDQYKPLELVKGCFECAITHDDMEDPVILPDGIAYESSAIAHWLQDHQRSPVCNIDMSADYTVSASFIALQTFYKTHSFLTEYPHFQTLVDQVSMMSQSPADQCVKRVLMRLKDYWSSVPKEALISAPDQDPIAQGAHLEKRMKDGQTSLTLKKGPVQMHIPESTLKSLQSTADTALSSPNVLGSFLAIFPSQNQWPSTYTYRIDCLPEGPVLTISHSGRSARFTVDQLNRSGYATISSLDATAIQKLAEEIPSESDYQGFIFHYDAVCGALSINRNGVRVRFDPSSLSKLGVHCPEAPTKTDIDAILSEVPDVDDYQGFRISSLMRNGQLTLRVEDLPFSYVLSQADLTQLSLVPSLELTKTELSTLIQFAKQRCSEQKIAAGIFPADHRINPQAISYLGSYKEAIDWASSTADMYPVTHQDCMVCRCVDPKGYPIYLVFQFIKDRDDALMMDVYGVGKFSQNLVCHRLIQKRKPILTYESKSLMAATLLTRLESPLRFRFQHSRPHDLATFSYPITDPYADRIAGRKAAYDALIAEFEPALWSQSVGSFKLRRIFSTQQTPSNRRQLTNEGGLLSVLVAPKTVIHIELTPTYLDHFDPDPNQPSRHNPPATMSDRTKQVLSQGTVNRILFDLGRFLEDVDYHAFSPRTESSFKGHQLRFQIGMTRSPQTNELGMSYLDLG